MSLTTFAERSGLAAGCRDSGKSWANGKVIKSWQAGRVVHRREVRAMHKCYHSFYNTFAGFLG